MCSFQSLGYLYGNTGCLTHCKTTLLGNIFFQCNAFYQLHHNEIDTLFFSDIVNINNIRMCQPRCCLRLCPEFCDKCLILTELCF